MLFLDYFCDSSLYIYLKSLLVSVPAIIPYFNELVFLSHNIVIAGCSLVASRFGKMGLTSFVMLCWILGNFLVQKEIVMFGQHVITSDGFAIGVNSALLLISTYYGQKIAKQVITLSCASLFFFLLMTQFHMWYIPSVNDISDIHYVGLFAGMPRIVLTSLLVSLISTHLNLFLFKVFSYSLKFLPQVIITYLALIISQILDTTLFAFLALYGNVSSITSIIVFSMCIKMIASVLNLGLIAIVQRYLSKPSDAL